MPINYFLFSNVEPLTLYFNTDWHFKTYAIRNRRQVLFRHRICFEDFILSDGFCEQISVSRFTFGYLLKFISSDSPPNRVWNVACTVFGSISHLAAAGLQSRISVASCFPFLLCSSRLSSLLLRRFCEGPTSPFCADLVLMGLEQAVFTMSNGRMSCISSTLLPSIA